MEVKYTNHKRPFWYNNGEKCLRTLAFVCVSSRCYWVVCSCCLSQQAFISCHAYMDRAHYGEKRRRHDSTLFFVLVYLQKQYLKRAKVEFCLLNWKLQLPSIVDHSKIIYCCSSVQFGIVPIALCQLLWNICLFFIKIKRSKMDRNAPMTIPELDLLDFLGF